MKGHSDMVLDLAVQVGALRYACERALALLENPDASEFDANSVEKLLFDVLNGIGSDHYKQGEDHA
jgi:hypothetical protein